MDDKICPKCATPMNLVEVGIGLPKLVGEGVRSVADKKPSISISGTLPAVAYLCPSCRFLEFYAG
jgi:hypothetical protein